MNEATAVVLERPGSIDLRRVPLREPGESDVVVAVRWSGISSGTERLLWSGEMPSFPGMGYPLVPGYESVGEVVEAGARAPVAVGETVFAPGSNGFDGVRSLFGGAASHLVLAGDKAVPVDPTLGPRGALLALAATAHHALAAPGARPPELIVGHGALGRLMARLALIRGAGPLTVWDRAEFRRAGTFPYRVAAAEDDPRRDYRSVYDVSGDPDLVDALIGRLAPGSGGEVVLAGFYARPVRFDFAPAFIREARLRIAAQWSPRDMTVVRRLVAEGELSLDGLITHSEPAAEAPSAYRTAFGDPQCLKMTLDWRDVQ